MFDKKPEYIFFLEKLCEHYSVDIGLVKAQISKRFFNGLELKIGNWKLKRYAVDVSYLNVLYGVKPFRYLTKSIMPSTFIRNLLSDVKININELEQRVVLKDLDKEKLKNSVCDNRCKKSGEDVVEAIDSLEAASQKICNKISDLKATIPDVKVKGGRRGIFEAIKSENKDKSFLENIEKEIKMKIKPEYFTKTENYLDVYPAFKRAAEKDKIIMSPDEEGKNISSKKMDYKDILLRYPIKLSLKDHRNDLKEVYSTQAFASNLTAFNFVELGQGANEIKKLEFKLTASESQGKLLESEKKSMSGPNKGNKPAKLQVNERLRATKMVISDTKRDLEAWKNKVNETRSEMTLIDGIVRLIQGSKDREWGSRFSVLSDQYFEDFGEPFVGKDKSRVKEVDNPDLVDKIQGGSFKMRINKKRKNNKGSNNEQSSRVKKMIKSNVNKREANRSKRLTELTGNKEEKKQIVSVLNVLKQVSVNKDRRKDGKLFLKMKYYKQNKKIEIIKNGFTMQELNSVDQSSKNFYLTYEEDEDLSEWLKRSIEIKIRNIKSFSIVD